MSQTIAEIIQTVKANMTRVAKLGEWPAWVNPETSLLSRIPIDSDNAPGFDAGLACCLGLIPEDKQRLAATLHAAYTPAAVEQVLAESKKLDSDSETVWWLAACSVCEEGGIGKRDFYEQIHKFQKLAEDPNARVVAAKKELENMKQDFTLVDGVPFVIRDGGMQGAYLDGHRFAVQYSEAYAIFFIGTFLDSLGLEEFNYSDKLDDEGRAMSGPVHGSKQFVKVSSFPELTAAIAIVKAHLG
jgi:hypothetical protein